LIYAFGDFELDSATYQLRRGGLPVKLEPKVFDVLHLLVRRRERVVTKAELLGTVWSGEHVTESALPRAVTAARKALEDDRVRQLWIRTVHGRGYRFVGSVCEPGVEEGIATAPPGLQVRAPGAVAPLLGREDALARMASALDQASAGRGRLVLLFGDPGIGKTRTAETFLEIARGRGFEAIAGRCYEGEGAPAFWPWVQILRGCTEEAEDDELAAELGREAATVAHLVPEVLERLGEALAPPLPSGGDEARFRLFDGVARYLLHRSRLRPLVLFVDDLHWADKPSALLLRYLASEIRNGPLLIIGAYREVELRRGSPLGEVVGDLTRLPYSERIPLRGLNRDAVGDLVTEGLGARPDDALIDAVAEITQGNPFFLNETLRLLRAERSLGSGSGDRSAWDATLPQGLRDVIGRRLDQLSEPCNRALTLAAVIGSEFSLPVLAGFAGEAPDLTLETLDEAVRARVVVESPEAPGRYAFSHALIQQSIYEELSTPVRVRMHRELGELLEEVYRAAPEPHLDVLAHHFFQAAPGGDVDKAVDYAARAGRAAVRLFGYEDAADWFTRALQALDLRAPDDPERRCDLLLELGSAYDQAGERQRMREVFSEAVERARTLGRPDLLALAAIGFAGRTERGTPDTGMRALLEEARDALGDRDPALRARLLYYLVGTPPYADRIETRLALGCEAAELARRAGDPLALFEGLSARGWSLAGPDYVDERLELADELIELADRLGRTEARFTGLETRLRSLLALGDTTRADREIAVYVALAEELRQPAYRFIARMYQVARALSTGRFEDASQLIAEGFELGRAAQHPATGPAFWGQWMWLHIVRGEFEELPRLLGPMFRRDVWVPERARPLLGIWRAFFPLTEGRREEARSEFERVAARGFAEFSRDENWLSGMANLATLSAALGDTPRSARLYDLLSPFARLVVVHDLLRTDLGPVAHYLGMLARVRGDSDAALEHFEAALAMTTRMGALPWRARAQAELADLCSERGDPGRAAELESEARATAAELGLVRLRLTAVAPPD
jgi:DNA-binding winged helix-turn-helix (wHTH) protein/tetratricopeptide (TPR) repeat protein